MVKPYSKDLRLKIVETYLEGNESIRGVAKRFQVSPSFVYNLLHNYRKTGSVNSKPHKGGRAPKLNAKQITLVKELTEQYNDFTLQELCDLIKEQMGIEVSSSTMSRITQKIRLNKFTSD